MSNPVADRIRKLDDDVQSYTQRTDTADTWRKIALEASAELDKLYAANSELKKERGRVLALDMRLRRGLRMLKKLLSTEDLEALEAVLTDDQPHTNPPAAGELSPPGRPS